MGKELQIFIRGHRDDVAKITRDWAGFTKSNPFREGETIHFAEMIESFNGDGLYALRTTEGWRNEMARRLSLFRSNKYPQGAPLPGDESGLATTGTIAKLSGSILGLDEEARAIAKKYHLTYVPIRAMDGVPVNMTLMNTAIWAARTLAVIGGVYLGEQAATFLNPQISEVAYVIPYFVALAASIPLVSTLTNGLRSNYFARRDSRVPVQPGRQVNRG